MVISWWRSLRTRIAAAMALLGALVALLLGVTVDRQAGIDDREQLRAQALDRLSGAVAGYEVDGRLRFGSSVGTDSAPAQLISYLHGHGEATWYDGQTMWAGRKVSDTITMTLALSGAGIRQQQSDLRRSLLLAGVGSTTVAGLLGWILAGRLSRRLRTAAAASTQIADGAPVRLADGGHDEVASLAKSVDQMADALAARLEAERAFTGNVAHDLRTPVTALVSAAELLPEGTVEDLVRTQVARIRKLVEDLLEIARIDATEPIDTDPVDLAALVTAAMQRHPEVRAELELDQPIPVLGEARRIDRILDNLLANVARHGGGVCVLRLRGADLIVSDHGPGFPETVVAREPGKFAGYVAHRMTGLGLRIVAGQAGLLGAEILLGNDSGGTVVVRFQPASQPGHRPVQRPGE